MDEKYQRGKIYTIRCHNDDTMIYIGSTIETLAQRMTKHRYKSKIDEYKNRMLFQAVNGNWNNWYIELYELCPCNSKEELEKREGEVMREISNLNERIAGRSRKEYREDNKEKIIEQKKEYYEDNKEKILEKRKEYYEDNKSKIIEQKKAYRDDNNEKILEQNKVYRENNKKKINEKQTQIVICQYCGCNSMKCNLPRHQKTVKCLKTQNI